MDPPHNQESVGLGNGEISPNSRDVLGNPTQLGAPSHTVKPPEPASPTSNHGDAQQPEHLPPSPVSSDRNPEAHGIVQATGPRADANLQYHNPAIRVEQWRSWKLNPATVIGLIVVTVLLVGGLITVVVLSHLNGGFVQVNSPSSGIGSYVWRKGLLWTVLPTFVLQVYRICFDAILAAASERQPYVELEREGGAQAEKSILLDYRAYFLGQREYYAVRNKHFLLAASFVMSVALSLGISPLAARLFAESTNIAQTRVPVEQSTTYDSASGVTALSSDLEPVFGVVTGTRIYNGSYPAWTTEEYGFQKFSTPVLPKGISGTPNFSVPTLAYSAYLDCVSYYPRDLHWYVVPKTGSTTEGTLVVSRMDRGCALNHSVGVAALSKTYVQTFDNTSCGADAGYTRIAVFGASIDSLHPSNMTVTSCIPGYWQKNGTLAVDLGVSASPLIQSFKAAPDQAEQLPHGDYRVFEDELKQIGSVDTTATVSANSFGRLILDLSTRYFPTSFLTGNALSVSTQLIFTSVYATYTTYYLFKPMSNTSSVKGTLSISTTRLFVVYPIAYIILAFLAVVLILLLLIEVYARGHKSILYEEPTGLLGQAGVTCKGAVHDLAIALRSDASFNGKTRETIVNRPGFRWDKRYRMEYWKDPSLASIEEIQQPGSTRPIGRESGSGVATRQ